MATKDLQGARDRAEARFDKAQKLDREKERIRVETALAAKAVDDKTSRLRALRLEKERADAVVAEEQAAIKAAAAPRKRRKASAA